MGQQPLVLMDEISTGLDSATTYSIIKTFRHALPSPLPQPLRALSLSEPWGLPAYWLRLAGASCHACAAVFALQGRFALAAPHLPHLAAPAGARSATAV